MNNIFKFKPLWRLVFPLLLGFTVALLSSSLVATARDAANSPNPNNASPEQTEPNNRSDRAPAQQFNSQSADARRDDQVYIDEIYPEYCRSYFHSRDWVTVFEYHEGMHRCLYGSQD